MTQAPRTTSGIGYDADLAHRFTYHAPEPEQPEVYQAVRDTAHLLAILVSLATPPSREQSLALTHIEDAVMWANAGIARRGLTGAGIAGAADLIEAAFQGIMGAKPDGALAGALSDTTPPPTAPQGDVDEKRDADPWATPEPPYTMLTAALTAIAGAAVARRDHALAAYAHSVLANANLPDADTLLATP
jgi:hypothetical protein